MSRSPTQVKLLRAAATIALLLLVTRFVNVEDSIRQLLHTDWRWLAPAFLVVQIQVILSAIRWKLTAGRLGQHLSVKRAISEYYLATFANLSLPGGVTGDAARVYRNRQVPKISVAVHGVVLERIAGQLALLLVSIIGWLLWPVFMQGSVPVFGLRVMTVVFVCGLLIALTVFFVLRFAPDWIARLVRNLGPAIYAAWWADRQWVMQSVLSLVIVGTYLLVFLFSSYAIGAPLGLASLVTIVPMVLLSMVIPLSVGGWGIREASAALFWPLAELSSEAGIATSIVYALVSLLGCVPGLFLLLKFRK